jgi:predicted nucleic acid-binding protein
MAEVVLLDTSACLTFLENEAGAGTVEACLLDARAGLVVVHASFVTLTEVEYITTREQGPAVASQALAKMRAGPVRWHHSDDDLCAAAARFKAAGRLSLADAFVAATAQRLGATLIHKDPEFEALGDRLKLQSLPLKTGLTQ